MQHNLGERLEKQMDKIQACLKNVKTMLITCRQFGDTGKGKVVDIFTHIWADIIVRGTGADNAGHTIVHKNEELVTHIVPSGIIHDAEGKINIIGPGAAPYPKTVLHELSELDKRGLSYNNLMISHRALVITPMQIVFDRAKEETAGKGKIGSTGKGVEPTYADFVGRDAIFMNDLLNPDVFLRKLKKQAEFKAWIIKNYGSVMIERIMNHPHLESGLYFSQKNIFDIDAIYERYIYYGSELKQTIRDTDSYIKMNLGKKNILGEGSQGDLLSIRRGTYPFVTSSDCSAEGLAQGMGINIKNVDFSLGVVKFPYMTRVGAGPFPSEMGGIESDNWCNSGESGREKEAAMFPGITINEKNDYLRGFKVRAKGNEYGATTGRPRRVGYLDLPLLRYAMTFNDPDVSLMKLDIFNEVEEIKICTEYRYDGPDYRYGADTLSKGNILKTAIIDCDILRSCKPIYKVFPGWQCSLNDCCDYGGLPQKLKEIIQFSSQETGIQPRIISVGPDREETIFI